MPRRARPRVSRRTERLPGKLVRVGVHLSRYPAEADALELCLERFRLLVALDQLCLFNHGAAIHLLYHEFRIHVDPNPLDAVTPRKL